MEQTANVLNTKRRKMLAAAGAGLALCVLTGLWLVRPRAAEEPPLRREYPVSRQDVTVGVDAAGSIQSRQWGQFAPVAVKLKEYRVSLGAQVAEGDVLAEYDPKDLQRLARESEARLAEKQSALDKLDLQKKDDEARLQKELDDLVGQGAPEEQLRPVREALAQNELDTADAQRQREEALPADYEGQAAEKQQQADTAKAAREQALAQLKQTEQQLQEKRDARDALRKKEDS